MSNVDFKMRPEVRTPFWRPRKEKTIWRTPKRGQILHPILRSTLPCPGTRRTVLIELVLARFSHPILGSKAFLFCFKRNDAEAYVWPKSDTRQARQKLRSNLPNLTNLRKKNPKHKRLWSQTSHDKTKTYNMNYDMIKYWVASKAGFMHGDTWAKPGEASKPEFLHMARPKRGRARPTISQN